MDLIRHTAINEHYLKFCFQGMTRGWMLMHLGLTQTFQHIGEATIASLMGIHSV